ncbi:aminopeptidase B. Metallo peptidase. MEROPS family M17 [Ferrimonas sediminum]|uniref:Aminopeptidase B. Metallo peptidase. MEROPS family M17 n=1 Tax=Ferrimonas sediminum TaxID=718193 RepID=A0A1G8M8G6_9GAMM|nr:aminopeptidase PepB [Ferrimonas sediminum]SDI64143.1 aminopeptidase B. Metallo peptidase. MEROPS family M17 [Ferrimonas sediminum]
MSKVMKVVLTHDSAAAHWGDASVSFDGDTASIHLSDGDHGRQVQAAARKLSSQGIRSVCLCGDHWTAALQWQFGGGFQTAKLDAEIQWLNDDAQLARQWQSATWLRELVNMTPEDLSPEVLADRVAEKLTELAPDKVSSKQWVGEALLAAGWVGIHGVGRGSERPPVMLELDYNPTGDADAPVEVALVGKGITFDSGGYSIKPSASMVAMKCDMGGAATVASALHLAIANGLDKRVKLFLCCAENLISGHAYKLGDILTYKNGTSVEIVNTDAEGRLVLADGLLAANEAGAKRIINAATLTGAVMVALGDDYNGLFGLHDGACNDALAAAAEVDEGLWRLPLAKFHQAKCPSAFADTANSRAQKGGGTGGASNAAGFLSRFAGEPENGWLHFDLAACYADSSNGMWSEGATAVGMLTLAQLLK